MLTVILLVVAGFLALPAITFVAAMLKGTRALPRDRAPTDAGELRHLLFLISAHNEEGLIGECVRSLVQVDYPADKRSVIVIANNCTDRTAEMARAAGARAMERTDLVRMGKPHALAWALEQLRDHPYETCVIVDADSIAEPSFARGVNALGSMGENAAQAYFATWNEDESWLTLLAGVFARAKYEVLYPIKDRASLNCPLTGNGMVFSAVPLKRDGWTAFSLTENWELYSEYTIAGHRIFFASGARLLSQEVRALRQGTSQRQRWTRGRRASLKKYGGDILRSDRIGWLQKLDALFELGLPGPVVAASVALLVAVLAVVLVGGRNGWLIAALALSSQLPLVTATLLVTVRHPHPGRVLLALARLPVYAVWRVGLALRTLGRPASTAWIRTQRNEPEAAVPSGDRPSQPT
ncbi:MAG TPA: glycosyltransferase family 2 protein [Gemmatimonadales bacterium]|nr:glycosyltransferase family 2 protein [Gemmatimonadales bacterium]